MSAITAKASRKMKKYAVLTREPRCFLGSFDFSWEQRKVQDVADRFDNLRIPVAANLRVHGTTPYYGANGIQDYVEGFTHDGEFVLVAEDGANDLKNYPVKCVNGRIWVNNHAHILQGKAGIADNSFLAFAISQSDIESLLVGGGRAKLNAETLMSIEFRLPCLQEQYRIGEYLTQLDHLITLHQRKCVFLFGFFQAFISMIFTASTFSWEQRKVGDLLIERNQQAPMSDEYPLMAFISNEGVAPKGERYDRSALVTDTVNKLYKKTEKGDFIYSSNNLETGSIGLNKYGKACISPVYSIFEPTGIADSDFLGRRLVRKDFINAMVKWRQGVIYGQWRIHESDFLKIEIPVPSVEEQRKIGAYLDQLDNLITLHQRECISFTARAGRLILTANKKRNTSSWEQRKLGDLVDRVVRKNINNESTLPLTISAQYGLVDQITYFNNRVASRDVSNYYLVLNGEFAYNKSTSDGYPFGAVKRLDLYEKGVLSTLYIVFAPKKEQQIDSDYLTVFFDTDRWHKGVAERAAEGARNHGLLNISAEDFFAIDLSVPKDIVEQKQIGAFIRQLDTLITLHQRKPFLMKWRTSDANRNQTNRLVL